MGARVTKVAATSQPSDPVKALRAAEPGTTTERLHTNAAQITVHPLHLARLNVSVPSPAIDSVDSPDSKSPSHDALQSDSHHQQFSTSSPAYQPSSLLSRTPQPVGYYELQPYSTFHSTMPQQTPRYETSAVQSALTPSAAAHSQRSSHYWASGTTTGDAKTTAVHNAPAPNHRVHLPPLSMPPTFPAPSSSSILPAPSARSGRAHAPSVPPHSTALTCTPLAGAVKGGQAALAPVDEEARVRALMSYRVLDTLPEEPFNQLAFLVTQICATPIALVSFVSTDRQWFKANVRHIAPTHRSGRCPRSVTDHSADCVLPVAASRSASMPQRRRETWRSARTPSCTGTASSSWPTRRGTSASPTTRWWWALPTSASMRVRPSSRTRATRWAASAPSTDSRGSSPTSSAGACRRSPAQWWRSSNCAAAPSASPTLSLSSTPPRHSSTQVSRHPREQSAMPSRSAADDSARLCGRSSKCSRRMPLRAMMLRTWSREPSIRCSIGKDGRMEGHRMARHSIASSGLRGGRVRVRIPMGWSSCQDGNACGSANTDVEAGGTQRRTLCVDQRRRQQPQQKESDR